MAPLGWPRVKCSGTSGNAGAGSSGEWQEPRPSTTRPAYPPRSKRKAVFTPLNYFLANARVVPRADGKKPGDCCFGPRHPRAKPVGTARSFRRPKPWKAGTLLAALGPFTGRAAEGEGTA